MTLPVTGPHCSVTVFLPLGHDPRKSTPPGERSRSEPCVTGTDANRPSGGTYGTRGKGRTAAWPRRVSSSRGSDGGTSWDVTRTTAPSSNGNTSGDDPSTYCLGSKSPLWSEYPSQRKRGVPYQKNTHLTSVTEDTQLTLSDR